MADRRVEYMPLPDVQRAARNPKAHARDQIAAGISRFGLGELPLLDERTGRLVAGHGRLNDLQARADRKATPPDGIRIADDGTWLIPIIRGWASDSDEAAEAYLVTSNRLTTLGGWDDPELAQLLTDVRDRDPALFAVTGFTDGDLADLLRTPTVLPDAEPPSGGGSGGSSYRGTVSAPGDLWALGEHRLLVGDATNPEHLEQLVDAIGQQPDLVHTAAPTHADNDNTWPAADAFHLIDQALTDPVHVWWQAQHYANTAGLPDSRCWLAWQAKARGTVRDEIVIAWTNHDRPARLSTVARDAKPGTWPTELAAWALDTVDPDGFRTIVLDPFARTGWTLLAAHDTGRAFAGLEKNPAHVDTACRAWQGATGRKPERLHPDGGREPVNF